MPIMSSGQERADNLGDADSVPEHVRVLPALTLALAEAGLTDAGLDSGTVAMAVRYAELLDSAVAAEKFTRALRLVGEAVSSYADDLPLTASEQLRGAWDRISSSLAEHSVASDLGPKLLATLTALNLTPAARGAVKAASTPAAPAAAPQTALERARERAARRNGSATA